MEAIFLGKFMHVTIHDFAFGIYIKLNLSSLGLCYVLEQVALSYCLIVLVQRRKLLANI